MAEVDSNGGDDAQMPREQLMPMIISQLQHYGLNSIAKVVAEASDTPLVFDPQPALAELCLQGKLSRDNDDTEMIVPSDMADDMSDEEEANNDSDAQGGSKGWKDRAGPPAKPVPKLTTWFSTQHRESCRAVVFSADGKYIATGSEDSSLKVLDVARIKLSFRDGGAEKPVVRTLYDHSGPVNDIQFHPNGTVLASCSHDQTIKLFDIQKPNIRYAPSGKIFATAGEDGSIKIWDTVSGICTRTISRAHTGRPVTSVKFSKNGRFVLSCGLDSVGRLWDLQTGTAVQEFIGAVQKEVYTTSTFNYNEDYVFSTDEADSSIVVWDSKTGAIMRKIPAHMAPLRGIAASPVENAFITCSDDYRAKYWGERD
ncbi:cleavage stimulation factor, 3' pre-RNA, subunit 1 [Thoreauomyces humboldtii]|nr:cleavage stimulation factor, 3' pre-RNA, subunit 1 [Thoreauomyces humboldtii]